MNEATPWQITSFNSKYLFFAHFNMPLKSVHVSIGSILNPKIVDYIARKHGIKLKKKVIQSNL